MDIQEWSQKITTIYRQVSYVNPQKRMEKPGHIGLTSTLALSLNILRCLCTSASDDDLFCMASETLAYLNYLCTMYTRPKEKMPDITKKIQKS